MIRITGGKFKQKKLASINDFVRPTSSLKREAFFSVIESYAIKNSIELYKNKIFLDLFAGIGTMGLEAISRGVNEVVFFENNNEVINILRKNCLDICKNNQFKIYEEDLINSKLEIEFQNISIVYIDPPYTKYNLTKLLENLSNKIKDTTLIGLETSIKENFVIPENLNLLQKKTYGKTIIYFLKLS
ncbi:RsmD family RNA methyltransferase [Pelagibacteraceae bacterium]|nr:RsmD family RNA methyltransferase [Pelagibacteraceae bacterium]